MKCVLFVTFLALALAQETLSLATVTTSQPQESSLEALTEILNDLLERLGLPTVNPESITLPNVDATTAGRKKRDLSGLTGLPTGEPSVTELVDLLNQLLEALNLPTVNPESVTVSDVTTAGRKKRDVVSEVTGLPTGAPSLTELVDVLNQILEALSLPTVDPESVTVPDTTAAGRKKRAVDVTGLPTGEPAVTELVDLLNQLLEALSLPTISPESVTVPDATTAGRKKRDVLAGITGLPTGEPSVTELVEFLNAILEALNLPTVNPEAVTDVTTVGRAKRDVDSGSSDSTSSESSSNIFEELIQKIKDFFEGLGDETSTVAISRATRVPVTLES
ncbi:unnamed protein product [Bursaphelenchus okinawaensis]|uniref:Uncharacterized protein n=1 Tax=Bursaphelenchus okinawaensis TaxID=465554 RepID=A0A811L7T3_9BILA|nr:unnamed protein product [Bursaphelenchus okinawaensis]CAG9118713.1 unnamed protein product [Bursaphelenchus okinawaensis]